MPNKPNPNDIELRSLVKPVQSGEGRTVTGYAAVFGEVTQIGNWFSEVIQRGAFAESLKNSDVRAYFDHDRGRVLGRSTSGTLRLSEDTQGLAVEIDLPDTSDGRDVEELIKRGDISGMSFGFRVTKEQWDETQDPPLRTILAVDLREVSIVSEPAYDGTSIALRSRDECRKSKHPAHARISARKAEMENKLRGI